MAEFSQMGATRRDLMAAMAALPAAMALPGALRAATAAAPATTSAGVKIVSIVARKGDMTQDRFRQHWLGIHGPMARKVPGLNGFVLSEAVQDSGAAKPDANYKDRFDGIAHIWYPNAQALRGGMATPDARAWLADGDLFIDRAASRNYFVSEQIVVAPPRSEGGIKQTTLVVRKSGQTHEQFMTHWTGTHAQLAQGVPGLIGCVFNRIETSLGTQGSPWAEIDGIAEVWWDSGAVNLGGIVASPQASAWFADGNLFIDRARSRAMISLEHAMIDPAVRSA